MSTSTSKPTECIPCGVKPSPGDETECIPCGTKDKKNTKKASVSKANVNKTNTNKKKGHSRSCSTSSSSSSSCSSSSSSSTCSDDKKKNVKLSAKKDNKKGKKSESSSSSSSEHKGKKDNYKDKKDNKKSESSSCSSSSSEHKGKKDNYKDKKDNKKSESSSCSSSSSEHKGKKDKKSESSSSSEHKGKKGRKDSSSSSSCDSSNCEKKRGWKKDDKKDDKDKKFKSRSSSSSSSCSDDKKKRHDKKDDKKDWKKDDKDKKSKSRSSSSSSSCSDDKKKRHDKKDDKKDWKKDDNRKGGKDEKATPKKRSKSCSSSSSSDSEKKRCDRKKDRKDDHNNGPVKALPVKDDKPEIVIPKPIDNGWFEPFCCEEKPLEKKYPTVKIQIQEEKHEKDSCGKDKKSKVIAFTGKNFLQSFNDSVREALKCKDVETIRETLELLKQLQGVPITLCNSLECGREFTVINCNNNIPEPGLLPPNCGPSGCVQTNVVSAVRVVQCNKGARPAKDIKVIIKVVPIVNVSNCDEAKSGNIPLQFGEPFDLCGLLVNLDPSCSLEEQGIYLSRDKRAVIFRRRCLDICECYCKDIGLNLTGNALGYTGCVAVLAKFEADDYCSQEQLQFRHVQQLLCAAPV